MLAFSYVIDDEMMQLFTRSHFETPSSESMNRELCGKCKVIVYKFFGDLSRCIYHLDGSNTDRNILDISC